MKISKKGLVRYVVRQLGLYKYTTFLNPKEEERFQIQLANKIVNKIKTGKAYPNRKV